MSQTGLNILFISSTLGLGHITRDIAIAKEIRKTIPNTKINWVAAPPVCDYLKEHNETLLPESKNWPSETLVAENTREGVNLNLTKYLINVRDTWNQQWNIFKEILDKHQFDLIIGDEAYQIVNNLIDAAEMNEPVTHTPFIIIYDFIGDRAMTDDPKEIEMVRRINDKWLHRTVVQFPEEIPQNLITRFFVGEIDDIEPRETLKGITDFKEAVKDHITFLGNIIRFDPQEFKASYLIREKLGYSSSPLVVCSVGGSNVGVSMFNLCIDSYKILEEKVPGLQMVLVCGPRMDPEELDLPSGVKAYGYVSNLIELFAACDLAIIQLGLSSAMELIALEKPFIYFPIPQHFEQDELAKRFNRRNIGVDMSVTSATVEALAKAILDNLSKEVRYPITNFNGAKNAALAIKELTINR